MKPVYITLKNYKRYGDEETTLDLSNNGVTVISGKMGVGKTSFVDAIIWNLYSKSLCSADAVVNRATKKNCKVEFAFIVDTDKYCIIRYRKHDEYKNNVVLFKNGKNISGIDTKKTQEMIEEIIGISYRALISSVIFSSEIYISFLRSKGYSDRLKILENILNLGIVNKWLDTTKGLAKPILEKIQEYNEKVNKIDFGVETLSENIEDYKNKSKEKLMELKSRKQKIEKELEEYSKKLEELSHINVDEEIEEVRKFTTIKEKNEFTNKKIKEEESNVYDVEGLEKEINGMLEYSKTLESVDFEKEKILINEYEKIKKENSEIKNKIENLTLQKKTSKSLENDLSQKQKELDRVIGDINSIEHKNSCPLCGQEIDKEKTNELLCAKEERSIELKSEIQSLEKDIIEIKEKNESLNKEIDEIKVLIKDELIIPKYSLDEIDRLRGDRAETDSSIKEKSNSLNIFKESNSRTIKRINDLKMEILEEGSEPVRDYDFLINLKGTVDELREKVKSNQNEMSNISENAKSVYDKNFVDGMQTKIDKLLVSKESSIVSLQKKEKEKEYYDFFLDMFANKEGGIKKEIIGRMIDAFNKKVNHYIPYFMPTDRSGIKIIFDNNLKETITEDGQEIEYDSFSSGEKTVLEISVAFSLFMIAKEFFSSSISFIVFDEILDGNLDDEASAKVAKVVNDLGESNCVMLISHRRDLKESFSNHILIERDKKGFSVIKNL